MDQQFSHKRRHISITSHVVTPH